MILNFYKPDSEVQNDTEFSDNALGNDREFLGTRQRSTECYRIYINQKIPKKIEKHYC